MKASHVVVYVGGIVGLLVVLYAIAKLTLYSFRDPWASSIERTINVGLLVFVSVLAAGLALELAGQ